MKHRAKLTLIEGKNPDSPVSPTPTLNRMRGQFAVSSLFLLSTFHKHTPHEMGATRLLSLIILLFTQRKRRFDDFDLIVGQVVEFIDHQINLAF